MFDRLAAQGCTKATWLSGPYGEKPLTQEQLNSFYTHRGGVRDEDKSILSLDAATRARAFFSCSLDAATRARARKPAHIPDMQDSWGRAYNQLNLFAPDAG